jgi:hypothetical protein
VRHILEPIISRFASELRSHIEAQARELSEQAAVIEQLRGETEKLRAELTRAVKNSRKAAARWGCFR